MGDMYLIQSRYTGIESVFMKKPEKIMRGSMMGGAATSVMLPSQSVMSGVLQPALCCHHTHNERYAAITQAVLSHKSPLLH